MCAIYLRFGLPSARAEPSRPSDSSVNVELVPFVGVAAVVIVTPGVDMALVARNSLLHGRNAGLATAIGVNVGVAVWVIAAAVGVAAIVRSSATVFTGLKLVGAAYL